MIHALRFMLCALVLGAFGPADNVQARSAAQITAPEPRASSQLSPAELRAARAFDVGGFRRIKIHASPKDFRAAPFRDESGEQTDLSAFEGKVVFVNLWGTWCPPCVREMPSINNLQHKLAEEDFVVVPVNFEPGGREAEKARRFFNRAGLDALSIYTDRAMSLARYMGVTGRPVTAILGRDGREIARLAGDTDWDSPDAVGLIRHLIAATAD